MTDTPTFAIRDLTPKDWPQASRIYAQGIATGMATFETRVPTFAIWDKNHLPHCRLAAVSSDALLGWAALSAVSRRYVYRGVAEVSIYVGSAYQGLGVGYALLSALIQASEHQGIWSLQASIFPENRASRKLHEKSGFRAIGVRERIAKQHGIWKDNVLYERRSQAVGLS